MQETNYPLRSHGRLYGAVLVCISTILWSTAGFFVRLIDLDVWTMVAWRSLFAFVTLLTAVVWLSNGRKLSLRKNFGWAGIVYTPIAAISMVSYIVALRLTTVANVMTVYATVPFVAAGIAYFAMRERVERRVMLASGVGFLGVVVMAGFATATNDIAGNAMALLMTICFAATVVMARRWPALDLTLVTALASAICGVVCFALASSAIPTLYQLILLFLFSLATQSLSYVLFLIGGRYIPSAEAGLIALLDVVLGPLWVWGAFAERPGTAALFGGGMTVSAVLLYLAWQPKGKVPNSVAI
jgi:drug/metabolite transporter (DMT)-like permease